MVPWVMKDLLQFRYSMVMGTEQASPRTVTQLCRAVLKLQLLTCISIKVFWDDNNENSIPTEISSTAKPCREDHTKYSPWTQVCVCHWNSKYKVFPCLHEPLWDTWPSHNWGAGLGVPLTFGSFAQKGTMWGYIGQAVTDSSTQASGKSWFFWALHRKQGSFICCFQSLLTLIKVGVSATASFDSCLGSFILSAQSAPMFSTSPLTYLVSTLSITFIIFSWAIPFWKQIIFS